MILATGNFGTARIHIISVRSTVDEHVGPRREAFKAEAWHRALERILNCGVSAKPLTKNAISNLEMEMSPHLRLPQPKRVSSDRFFGLVFAAFFALLGLWPLVSGETLRIWALVTAATILAISLLAPSLLKIPNRVWLKFGDFLHKLVSPVVLAVLFFLVLTPWALVMRITGRDALRLKRGKALRSFWIKREPPGPPPESMSRQF